MKTKEKAPKNADRKKPAWRPSLAMLVGLVGGGLLGFWIAGYADRQGIGMGKTLPETLFAIAALLVGLYLVIFVQTILHEAGHLVFGLLSGYRFSSFRIGGLMLTKEEQGLRLRRLEIAGTGGQCLMCPPELVDGQMPVLWYNLGGPLMNLIAALALWAVLALLRPGGLAALLLQMGAWVGLLFALLNGVPMHTGTVDNDGYNALALLRQPQAVRAIWVQMKVADQLTRGARLREMPVAWFAVPSDEAMRNSLVAVLGVYACNRLMDAQRFEEADLLMQHLLAIPSGLAGLYRGGMLCDRSFCEMIGANRPGVLKSFFTAQQQQYMKQMKRFPSVLRTRYAHALLCEQDADKAAKLLAQFEACAKSYPYQGDIEGERELMRLAEEIAAERAARPGNADNL